MNREFKFRAIIPKENRYKVPVGMIEGENIKTMLESKFTKIPGEHCWEEIGLILMQFTGLKDKNGVEIYEGDIVKIFRKNMPPAKRNETVYGIGIVEFNALSFGINKNNEFISFWNYINKTLINYTFEVIGNIYQNPELIK